MGRARGLGKTRISYLTRVWSPVNGCSPCSPGCEHCWSRDMARRFKRPWGRPILHPERLDDPLVTREPQVVGVCFTADWLHPEVPLDFIYRMIERMAAAPYHTYVTCTKRPHRFGQIGNPRMAAGMENLWLMVSVCTRDELWKLDALRDTPAAHRGVSFEPLLEDLGEVNLEGISRVVAGAESGPGARHAHCAWFRSIEEQCRQAGVKCYTKQVSGERGEPKVIHFPMPVSPREWWTD